jgi:hypothetical protein
LSNNCLTDDFISAEVSCVCQSYSFTFHQLEEVGCVIIVLDIGLAKCEEYLVTDGLHVRNAPDLCEEVNANGLQIRLSLSPD